ncbi:hypothetical protein NDU88_004797 [Pleurodeles waltl]|uniref:Uncharacterized protein n=1 Tax=Pleurodeles waltl TaxID=8319 RepID=A0AAV7KYT0_PLEWA|nr:hypothetical protein NDU88_004797 [Pleurodeles waltl]
MRRARARVLNGRRWPLRDAVSEGQKKGRAFPYNNRALNTQVSQCNGDTLGSKCTSPSPNQEGVYSLTPSELVSMYDAINHGGRTFYWCGLLGRSMQSFKGRTCRPWDKRPMFYGCQSKLDINIPILERGLVTPELSKRSHAIPETA